LGKCEEKFIQYLPMKCAYRRRLFGGRGGGKGVVACSQYNNSIKVRAIYSKLPSCT
jgi:hypothetical protein